MPENTIFLLCDVQTQFRSAIHGYDHVVATTNKMLKFAKLLKFPVLVTTQNVKALGPTDPAIDLASLGDLVINTVDKTLFSMVTEEVLRTIYQKFPGCPDPLQALDVVLMGIESHICMLQTALDLRARFPHWQIYVIADATSSCNSFEIPYAFEIMRQSGVKVITSESFAFLKMRDANTQGFKDFLRIIKEEKANTKAAGEMLLAQKIVEGPGVLKSSM